MLLGVDIGTTHCKVGLFRADGTLSAYASHATPAALDATGHPVIDPEALWQLVRRGIAQVTQGAEPVQAAGVTSMAESGLLLERASGRPRTPMIPWYSQQASAQVGTLTQAAPVMERFAISGIRPNYKCSLAKILSLIAADPAVLDGAVWLSAADYIVYRLTGTFVTDHSLAGRTYAFDIHARRWDTDWLASLGLPQNLFADAQPAGTPYPSRDACLPHGTPVSVAGHDHVCAAFAAGAIQPDHLLDSMGTAETLLGAWSPERPLTGVEARSGLLFGCHVIPDHHYWMGSLSASGGSIEWLRAQLSDPSLSYAEIEALVQQVEGPTGILYFPYLAGSSHSSSDRAALIGLKQTHGRAHLLKAALEGTAYEIEHLRAEVDATLSVRTQRITVVGGGTRSPAWLQIKADVSGCVLTVYPTAEAALLGAVMVAGLGSGVYASPEDALVAVNRPGSARTITPLPETHARYRQLFDGGYLPLMPALRSTYAYLAALDTAYPQTTEPRP
jgi:xylulokinase